MSRWGVIYGEFLWLGDDVDGFGERGWGVVWLTFGVLEGKKKSPSW